MFVVLTLLFSPDEPLSLGPVFGEFPHQGITPTPPKVGNFSHSLPLQKLNWPEVPFSNSDSSGTDLSVPPAAANPVPVRQRSGTRQVNSSRGQGGQARGPVESKA